MNIYKKYGLREVINANGKMTILGASAVSSGIGENVKEALQNFVIIDELLDYTGKVIAERTGAPAGCPTCGAAAGIAISVAACIAGNNLELIERMPQSDGLKNEIVVQKGHIINFGGNIAQMVRLGGGKVVEAGCANKVEKEHIKNLITERTAALFYIKSHHAVQKGMQSIETMLSLAKDANIPLIIDAAAEEDMKKYIRIGADLVIYSGGKALAGPTSGFVCGKKELITACKEQYKGIGRAMKVSKEAMVGLITALHEYDSMDSNAVVQEHSMKKLCDSLNEVAGLSCRVIQDEAGREIYRAEIKVEESKTGISAAALNQRLKNGNPAIYLRDYYVNQGVLSVDPRPLLDGQREIVIEKIKAVLEDKNVSTHFI